MIKLPGPVVVAGYGGEQPETVSQRTQSPPRIRILMVDFDAVQSVITSQRLQHARWKQALAAATPRVGDHRKAARLVHQVYGTINLYRVAVNVGWTTIGQEAVECLLPIANVTCLDQRIGNVRTANRRTVADLGHHLRLAHRHTQHSQLAEDAGEPTQPAVADSRHLSGQLRTCRISTVRQDVHTIALTRAGELHAADHVKTQPFSLSHCFIEAVEGVVISQCNDIETDSDRLAHQLSRCVSPVGDRGVSMQVNPHASGLPRILQRHPGLHHSLESKRRTTRRPTEVRARSARPLVMERSVFTDSDTAVFDLSQPSTTSRAPLVAAPSVLRTAAVSWACTACRSSRRAARAMVCHRSSRGSSMIRPSSLSRPSR